MAQIEQSIEVNVPVSTAYNQWTQFEDFPRFMEDISEVRQIDDTHLHWVAELGGKIVEWDAEITEQKPDERVAWKSTSGKPNAGVVTFHRLSDTSCKVMAQMDYQAEGIVEKIGNALGADERRVKSDLESFKAMVEERGSETGAWRGEIHADPDSPANGSPQPAESDTAAVAKEKVEEVLVNAKEGFDNLGHQKIGAKIGGESS
jgi:uncharacterized membrane protein